MQRPARSLRGCNILDRVHEHVQLPGVVRAALDTPWVQRLRGLKQLGVSSWLYPGAIHTRFEHSVGVAHLAGVLSRHLAVTQPELGFREDTEVTAVMLAGLFHDLGHGPFSHLYEDVVAQRLGFPFDHEAMSRAMARRAMADPRIGATPAEIDFICALMAGAAPGKRWAGDRIALPGATPAAAPASGVESAITGSRRALAEVVTNKRCGIDVDKLDYFMRDAQCCFGKPSGEVRLARLFGATRAAPLGTTAVSGGEEVEEWGLAFEEKMALTLRDFWTLRARLHKTVYQHHVVKATGHMIGDGLALAEPFFLVGGRRLSECCDDPESFLPVGDWILDSIAASTDPALADARAVITRLRHRDLYKLVSATCVSPKSTLSADDMAAELAVMLAATSTDPAIGAPPRPLSAQDARHAVIVDFVTINHGRGARDPLADAYFFNPKKAGGASASPCVVDARRRVDVASLTDDAFTPRAFEERTAMVFCREPELTPRLAAVCRKWWGSRGADIAGGLPALNAM